MNILLDTHCWLWWFIAPENLGVKSRSQISNPKNVVYFSAASAWELAIKASLGKLELALPLHEYVPSRLEKQNMVALPINLGHALQVSRLPHHHKDPFDRLLIAQAQLEKFKLMTVDPQFKPYEADLLWGRD